MLGLFTPEDLLRDSPFGSTEVVIDEGLLQLHDEPRVFGLHYLRKLLEVVLEEDELCLRHVVSEGDVFSHIFVVIVSDLELQ